MERIRIADAPRRSFLLFDPADAREGCRERDRQRGRLGQIVANGLRVARMSESNVRRLLAGCGNDNDERAQRSERFTALDAREQDTVACEAIGRAERERERSGDGERLRTSPADKPVRSSSRHSVTCAGIRRLCTGSTMRRIASSTVHDQV